MVLLAMTPHLITAQDLSSVIASYGPKSVRPNVFKHGTFAPADAVETQLYIERLMSPNPLEHTYGFDGYLRVWWYDDRLKHNGTFPYLSLGAAERAVVWKPDLYLENNRQVRMPSEGSATGELMNAYPDGRIWWSRQVSFQISCPFAGLAFDTLPFDEQQCNFSMGMYGSTANEVYLRWRASDPANTPDAVGCADCSGYAVALENWQGPCLAEWHATELDQVSDLQTYNGFQYTFAKSSMKLARAPTTWLNSYVLPAIIMVIVSYLGFYIDPAATPARVSLGLITLLIQMTSSINLSTKLPPSNSPSWLARFVLASFNFSFVALIEQVLVSFGGSVKKWLDTEHAELERLHSWTEALIKQKSNLLGQLDDDCDGRVSKREFRRGIRRLGINAKIIEMNRVFDHYDQDKSGSLTLVEIEAMVDALGEKAHGFDAMNSTSELSSKTLRRRMTAARGGGGLPPQPVEQQKHGMSSDAVESIVIDDGTELAGDTPDEVISRPTGLAKGLGKGRLWHFKTFVVFPVVQHLRFLDYISRVVFPLAYITFLAYSFSEVGFGREHYERLMTSPCYLASLS